MGLTDLRKLPGLTLGDGSGLGHDVIAEERANGWAGEATPVQAPVSLAGLVMSGYCF